MDIATTRFGLLAIAPQETLRFPAGLPGLEECRHWVLLVEPGRPQVAWLQSIDRPEIALAVVDPRDYVPHYDVRVSRQQLLPLSLMEAADVQVLAVVSRDEHGLTLNLKAPLVINYQLGTGHQLVNNADWPVSYPLEGETTLLRKTA